MELKDYDKEELQILLMAVLENKLDKIYGDHIKREPSQSEERILKAWIERIRTALKDK